MTWVGKGGRRWALPFICALFVASCDRGEPARERKLAGRDFRTVVYSEAFRQRFGLRADGVHLLDAGLEAVAIRLEHSPYFGARCSLDMYVGDSLDLDYPEGTSGRFDATSVYGRMFFMGQLSAADAAAVDDRWAKPRWVYARPRTLGSASAA